MIKKYLSVLLAVCLILSGCGTSDVKAAYKNFSEELSAQDGLSFTASLRAEYEHKTARFTLSYTEDAERGTVTVVKPELIAGVSAHVEHGGTSLEYDGVMLDTGDLDEFGLSPMSSLPMLVQALREGYLDSFWAEDGKSVYQLVPNDNLVCTVWFEPETMTPVRAELISGGRVKVFVDISDWSTVPVG